MGSHHAGSSPTLDVLALGEVMLRLDPGESRIRAARQFEVHVGGGEFNVAAGLSTCFGMRTGLVSALPANDVGELVLARIREQGVSTDLVLRSDAMGARAGVNFTERGFGARGARGVSDRADSCAAQIRPGTFAWDELFADGKVRWLHTGGVFSALSAETAATTLEAVRAARRHGVTTSYDVNHRASLWDALPDPADHARTVSQIFENVDVLISNEPEYLLSIGRPPGPPARNRERFERMLDDARTRFPSIKVFAATDRVVHSASRNDWGALGWSETDGLVTTRSRHDIEILDRVGGGDAFVAGLVYGTLSGHTLHDSLELGIAHGVLTMTTPGDVSQASLAEVQAQAAHEGVQTIR